MYINIRKLNINAKIPTQGTEYSAGFDLYAELSDKNLQISIPSNECVKISTGICLAIPTGYVGLIFPRSGLSTNRGLRLANCVGVIDSDYRGEILVPLYNDNIDTQIIHHEDRIAQIVFMKLPEVILQETANLDDTERGTGGFGSTDFEPVSDDYSIPEVGKKVSQILNN